ncbi:MAG: glutathione S-transferase family protein [Polyangiales bacterium]
MDRVLYQFPISHYCEKARWVLDIKRIPYRIHNQLPGPHGPTNRGLTGRTSVPVLVEDGRAIGGSHAIAMHLEAQQPEPALVPKSAAARAQVDELVVYVDDVVGPAVRQYAYSLILPRIGMFREIFFGEYRGASKLIGSALARPLSWAIGSMYRVRDPSVRHVPDVLRTAADRIESRLRDGAVYLFEDTLSLADITVASLLGPVIGPAGSPWELEIDIPELRALRSELGARPIGRYITDLYTRRPPTAALQ